jgi:DNA-binding NtrC family response regulator
MPNSLSHESLWVVDDDPMITRLIQLFVQRASSLPIHEFSSPEEALEALPAGAPSLVVTDLTFFRMDGWEFVRRLKQHSPQTRVILLTGQPVDVREAREKTDNGIDLVLFKPVHWPELVQAVMETVHAPAA